MERNDIDEIRSEILALLDRNGPASSIEIVEALNRTRRATPAAVDVALWGLAGDERIRSTQRDNTTCWEMRP